MRLDEQTRGIFDRALERLRREGGAEELAGALARVTADSGAAVGGSADQDALIAEIQSLSEFIEAARQDLASLRPSDIQERFIPTASDELDAIVQATETATHDIMDAVEGLEALGERLSGEDAELLTQATMRIYEACTFQDITGQRITKVVRTLKSIEERVDGIVQAFAPEEDAPGREDPMAGRAHVVARGDRPEDAALLNGPGKSGEAMNQADIDALLKDFD